MRNSSHIGRLLFAALWITLLMVGCTSTASRPADAIEAYITALEAKDLNKMISLSCAEWEAQAKLEYDSFAAVKVTLEDVNCQQIDQQDEYTLVSCEGKIIASYGAEDLIIELPERTYIAVQEGGEWRMCGNQ